MKLSTALICLLSTVFSLPLVAEGTPDTEKTLPPTALPLLADGVEGPVFRLLAADHGGRLFTLDPKNLTVHIYDDKGRAQEPVELHFVDPPKGVLSFDVNATGRVWALSNPRDIYFFRDDGHLLQKQELDDPPAQVLDIALSKLGSSVYVNRRFWDVVDADYDGHTLIGRMDDRGNESDVAFELESQEKPFEDSFRRLMLLDIAEDGRLWAIERGRYEVWELTAAGRKLTHLWDEEVALDFTSGPTPDDPDLPYDAAKPPDESRPPSKTRYTLQSVVRDFDTRDGLLWTLVQRPGKDQQLDVLDPLTGSLRALDLPSAPSAYQSLAVTDRYVVLATGDPDHATIIDRAELLFRLSEREVTARLSSESADPDDPLAEVEAPEAAPKTAAPKDSERVREFRESAPSAENEVES
jgi:hypothetical protein